MLGATKEALKKKKTAGIAVFLCFVVTPNQVQSPVQSSAVASGVEYKTIASTVCHCPVSFCCIPRLYFVLPSENSRNKSLI